MPPKPDVRLEVLLVPRSSQNRIEFTGHAQVKAWVSAPPVDGAANEALIALVAKTLDVPKSNVSIESGATSRRKRILVTGMSPEHLPKGL